jgi:hypothetical protein
MARHSLHHELGSGTRHFAIHTGLCYCTPRPHCKRARIASQANFNPSSAMWLKGGCLDCDYGKHFGLVVLAATTTLPSKTPALPLAHDRSADLPYARLGDRLRSAHSNEQFSLKTRSSRPTPILAAPEARQQQRHLQRRHGAARGPAAATAAAPNTSSGPFCNWQQEKAGGGAKAMSVAQADTVGHGCSLAHGRREEGTGHESAAARGWVAGGRRRLQYPF